MRVAVKVLPREEVLDIQGRAVEKNLKENAKPVSGCRIGKYIVLDLETKTKEQSLAMAKEIAEFSLYNPLIENYSLEVLE